MKLRTGIALLGLGLSAAAFAFGAGCSSDPPATSSAGAPPARPGGPVVTGTDQRTFAINSIRLGKGTEWRTLGYNLDGKVSARGAKDVCKPLTSAPVTVHTDGADGRDNSFGQFIVPTLLQASATAEETLNASLRDGTFTVMIQTEGLPADGATGTGIKGSIFAGGENSADSNRFTKGADWPVTPALLLDGTTVAGGSKVKFDTAYMASGLFVSSAPSDNKTVSLSLSIGGQTLKLDIKRAVISHRPKGTDAMDGIIAGVINSSELVEGVKKIAGRLSVQACSGSLLQTIVDAINGASDMSSDGATDPSRECDAISIGLGFTAKEIGNPARVARPAAETPDPCIAGDGGAPDSGRADAGGN